MENIITQERRNEVDTDGEKCASCPQVIRRRRRVYINTRAVRFSAAAWNRSTESEYYGREIRSGFFFFVLNNISSGLHLALRRRRRRLVYNNILFISASRDRSLSTARARAHTSHTHIYTHTHTRDIV